MTITAAADGSALGNPGPAGWAWYIDDANWAAGGWRHATNNQGELKAVLDLFQSTAHVDDDLLILCDSQYVINCVTKWMHGWKKKGWRKGDGKPVMNVDLLREIDDAIVGRRYRFEWVRGHVGHELNEAADSRARAVAEAFQRGLEIPAGPGLTLAPPPRRSTRAPVDDAAATRASADSAPSARTPAVKETAPSLFSFDDLESATGDDHVPPARELRLALSAAEDERLRERARRAGGSPEDFLRGLI
jgi:ribonuclease HI